MFVSAKVNTAYQKRESFSWSSKDRRIFDVSSRTTTDLYYSDQWQVLEERVSGTIRISYAWSPVYVDVMIAMIARNRDAGSLEERLNAIC